MSETDLNLEAVSRTPRLADVVSDRLLAAIRDAHLPPGAKLPSERELGEQFGVSRTVIREAIRSLTAKGILEVRSGSGANVANIDSSGVSDALVIFLRRKGLLDPQKIHEVRETLEIQTTRLAAQRATDDELAEIRAIHERLGKTTSPEAAAEADVAFHRAIAKAAENELFLVLVDSISDIMMDVRRATVGHPGQIQVGVKEHGRIVEALERRDVDGAVDAMRDHLINSLKALLTLGIIDGVRLSNLGENRAK